MDRDENTAPSASEYDDHEARITTQEKAVVDLRCEFVLFRQQTDANFNALRMQIEHGLSGMKKELRLELQASLHALEQRLTAKITDEIRRLETKIDLLVKWMIGLQLTTVGLIAAIIAHGYLS